MLLLSLGDGALAARDTLFLRLLKDPQNIELNLEYAKRAEKQGKKARAIATYERVLSIDPDNAEAKAALARLQQELQPDVTRFYAILGGQ